MTISTTNGTANPGTHRIRVEFNNNVGHFVKYYMLDEDTLDKARLRQAHLQAQFTPQQFADWLDQNGGQLDRTDGPAFIATYIDGTRIEVWYRNGQRDRADGPAYIETNKTGFRLEGWYRNGQRDRADGPAYIKTAKDGSTCEGWYRNGQRDRADGPAYIETRKDGSRIEEWWTKGDFIKIQKIALPLSIPGVTFDPPPAPPAP